MLDFGIGQAPSNQKVDAAFAVAARESGSYIDPGPGAEVVTPAPNTNGEPTGAANGSQPDGSGTNQTSSAAGSRR